MKKCSACLQSKSIESFSFNKSREDGRQTTCKDCINNNPKYKANKLIYQNSEIGQLVLMKSHLKNKFKMTIEDKQKMFDSQQGSCEICHKAFKNIKSACVDHNHETGKVRDLLCKPCNTFLGIIKEDVSKLTAYVEKHKQKQ